MKNKSSKHWGVLLVCCGLSVAAMGLGVNAVGVFLTPVSESLGVMRGTFAAHTTISLLVGSVMSLFIPSIIRKFPYKTVLSISVIIASISTIMMGFSDNILMFYVLGALRGISSALFSIVPLTMIINQWFEKKHGLATSIVLGISGLGGALFSPIFAYLIVSFGWETTFIIKGLVFLFMCLPAIFYPFSINPQNDGLMPYGYEANEQQEQGKKREKVTEKKSDFSFFQTTFLCFIVFSTLIAMKTTIAHHLPGFAETVGHSATTGAVLASAAMVGNVCFKLIIGVISDSFGTMKASVMMIGINVMGIIVLLTASSPVLLVIGAFLFGSLFSVGSAGVALLTKQIFGMKNYARTYPLIALVGGAGVAIGIALIGYIYDFTGSFTNTFIVALITHGISMLLLAVIVKQRNQIVG